MANEDVVALEGYRSALLRLPAGSAIDAAAIGASAEELAALNPNGDRHITRDEALRYVDALLQSAPAAHLAPSYDGMRAAFLATERLVTQTAKSRTTLTPPTAPSRRSLLEMVDTLWPRRDQPISENDVYRLYAAPREPNPLTITNTDYFGRLGRLAANRPAEAISNVQGLRLRAPVPNNAVTPVLDSAARGELPEQAASQLDRTFFRFERAGWRPENIRERVYIHAAANHAVDVAGFVVNELIDRPGAFPGVEMAKVSGPAAAGGRSENIVVYTDGPEAAERVVSALRRYQQNNPSHFMRTTNMLTEQRLPGVSLGAEPAPEHGGQFSFGSLRSAVVAQAFRDLREQQPSMTRADFLRHLDACLRQAGVDPERPHRNIARGATQ